MTVQHTMQTNGTLLNEAWCEFFREHNFLIGLSMDGLQAMHDTYRVDKGGAPTFHKVMRAALLFNPGGLTCGANPGLAVTPEYSSPFKFTGKIYSVTVDVSGDLIRDSEAEMRLVMARQ